MRCPFECRSTPNSPAMSHDSFKRPATSARAMSSSQSILTPSQASGSAADSSNRRRAKRCATHESAHADAISYLSLCDIPSSLQRIGISCIKDIRVGDELLFDVRTRFPPAECDPPHRHLQQQKRGEAEGGKKRKRDYDEKNDQTCDQPRVNEYPLLFDLVPARPQTDLAAAILDSAGSTIAPSTIRAPPPLLWTVRPSDGLLCCRECDRTYPEKATFEFHFHKLHSGKYACSQCTFWAGSEAKLLSHQNKHRRKEYETQVQRGDHSHSMTVSHDLPEHIESKVDPSCRTPPTLSPTLGEPISIAASRTVSVMPVDPLAISSNESTPTPRPIPTAEEWRVIQAKRSRIRATCAITDPMLLGSELALRPLDAAVQAQSLVGFWTMPGSALHCQSAAAEPVVRGTPDTTKMIACQRGSDGAHSSESTDLSLFALPRDYHAVHDILPGLRFATHTTLLRIPILSPAFAFQPSAFQLPSSLRGGTKKATPVEKDSAKGWGVSLAQLRLFQRRDDDDNDQDEVAQSRKNVEGSAAVPEASLAAHPLPRATMTRHRRRYHRAPPETGPYAVQVVTIGYVGLETDPDLLRSTVRIVRVMRDPIQPDPTVPDPVVSNQPVSHHDDQAAVAPVPSRTVIGVYAVAGDMCSFALGTKAIVREWPSAHRVHLHLTCAAPAPVPKRCMLLTVPGLARFCTSRRMLKRLPAKEWLLQVLGPRLVQLQNPEIEFGAEPLWQTRALADPTFAPMRQLAQASSATLAAAGTDATLHDDADDSDATEDDESAHTSHAASASTGAHIDLSAAAGVVSHAQDDTDTDDESSLPDLVAAPPPATARPLHPDAAQTQVHPASSVSIVGMDIVSMDIDSDVPPMLPPSQRHRPPTVQAHPTLHA